MQRLVQGKSIFESILYLDLNIERNFMMNGKLVCITCMYFVHPRNCAGARTYIMLVADILCN